MNIRYLTAAFAFVALAACNSEEKLSPFESDPNAVRITATVGEQAARSFPTTALDDVKATQFKEGDAIAVSAANQEAVTYLYTNGKWEPQGGNSLTWETDPQHFTAYYPAGAYSGTQSVPTKQDTEDDIAAADYMMFDGDLPKQDPIRLTMLRQTARIVIDATTCDWKDQYKNDKGEVTHEVKSILVHCKGETETINIQPYKVGNVYYALVNPSNNADAAEKFITIKVGPKDNDSSDEQDELIVRGIPILKVGNSYTYQLTLGKDKVELGSIMVSDWATGAVIDDGKAVEAGYLKLGPVAGKYSYHIYSLDGLLEVNNILANGTWEDVYNADITLYDDFVLPSGTEWTPLGNISKNISIGKFDGNGHSITGLVVNSTKTGVGLISGCSGGVYNLTLIGCQVTGKDNVGGITGYASTGDVTNCKIIATKDYPVVIKATGSYVGGLFGQSSSGSYKGCELICEEGANITISGSGYVGGMTGEDSHSNISQCKVINQGGTITINAASADKVGGLVGSHNGTMLRCEVDGLTVTGNISVGGLIGYVDKEGTVLRYEDEQPYIMNIVKNCTITGKSGSTGAGYGTNVNKGHTPAITADSNNNVTLN